VPTTYRIYSGTTTLVSALTTTNRTITLSDLEPSTSYKFGVVAVGDKIYNTDSDIVSITTVTNPLTELSTTNVWCVTSQSKARQLTFNWNSVTNAVGYIVQTGTTSTYSSNMVINGTSLTITGLNPNTTYRIRVRAKAADRSEYKDCETWATTNGTTLPLVKLQPPRNITLIGMTPTTLKFSYDPPAATSGMTGYYFYVNGSYKSSASMSTTRVVEFTNLTPDTPYVLGFQSVGDQEYADNSDITSVTQTPLSEKLVVSSSEFPSSDYWTDNEYEFSIQPKQHTTNGSVMTTVFTG